MTTQTDYKTIWKPETPMQGYLLALPPTITDAFVGGGRGGSKTEALIGSWIKHSATYGKHASGLLIRKTMPELEEILKRTKELFPLLGATFQAQKSIWTMPNGSQLRLRYLQYDDHASRYQGHEYTWIGADELPNWASPVGIDQLKACLRSSHGMPCFFVGSGNPAGVGHVWVKNRYITPMNAVNMVEKKTPQGNTIKIWTDATSGERKIFIPSYLKDNKFLANDPTYIERLNASGPPWLVKAWRDGDWDVTPEGGMIKTEWFRYYTQLPNDYRIVLSIDTAQKIKKSNDYTCIQVWGQHEINDYLIESYLDKLEYPYMMQKIKGYADKYAADVVLIEDKGSGTAAIQELKAATSLPVIAVEPKGDKHSRLFGVSGYFESGRVMLPQSATWLIDYQNELVQFPAVAHDDQCDATSQYLFWAHGKFSRSPDLIAADCEMGDLRETADSYNEIEDVLFEDLDHDEMENW